MQCGIEGALFDTKDVIGDVLDMQGDPPSVHGSLFQGFQNEEDEGSLQVFVSGFDY
jgi:hypothetical protein